MAIDHVNAGHPHVLVIVRGKDDRGKDLIIARSYMTHGLRGRAAELVDLDLGPRSPQEMFAPPPAGAIHRHRSSTGPLVSEQTVA